MMNRDTFEQKPLDEEGILKIENILAPLYIERKKLNVEIYSLEKQLRDLREEAETYEEYIKRQNYL